MHLHRTLMHSIENMAGIESLAAAAGFEDVSVARIEALEEALRPELDARADGRYPLHVLTARKPAG